MPVREVAPRFAAEQYETISRKSSRRVQSGRQRSGVVSLLLRLARQTRSALPVAGPGRSRRLGRAHGWDRRGT